MFFRITSKYVKLIMGGSVKKLLNILLLFICFLSINVKALDLDVKSNNIIMYNLDNNEVLFKKNDDSKVQIASLTKIMTALIVLDKIDDLDKKVTITYEDFNNLTKYNLATAGFKVGETVTYKDLLYGLLLPSGAEAAQALVRNISGNTNDFVKLMNEKTEELNLTNTHFSNPIGLDDENNYSTAFEVSKLFNYALKNNTFKDIITTLKYTTSDGKLSFKSTIQSNAKRYGIEVPYILGGKTGTTDGAGLCFASIAKEKNIHYMLVTLGAVYDKKGAHHIEDAKTIYEYFMNNYDNYKIVDKKKSYKSLKTVYLKENEIKLYPKSDIIKYLPNNYDINDVRFEYDGVDEVSIFTNKNLGTLKIFYKDELLKEEKVVLKNKVNFSFHKFFKHNALYVILIFLLIMGTLFVKRKKHKKRRKRLKHNS